MKKSDQYHKWAEWSEEDQVYIGKCPDVLPLAGVESARKALDPTLPANQLMKRRNAH